MKQRKSPSAPAATQEGLVIGSFGRHVLVEDPQGDTRICHPKGKRNDAVVGDRILWQASEDEGRIVGIVDRKNLLFRQDEMRTKSFAANLDQVCLFLAAIWRRGLYNGNIMPRSEQATSNKLCWLIPNALMHIY